MIIVRFLWNTLLIILLFIAILIVIIGGLFVLRVECKWWLDVDYAEKLKEWVKR